MRSFTMLPVVFTLLGSPCFAVDFSEQIKPILSDRCFRCHGPDAETREADLRLDIREEALRESETGDAAYVIKPGSAADSEVFLRIKSDDPDLKMPPPDSKLTLTSDEIELIQEWIDAGADWTEHWSFQELQATRVPIQEETAWPQNEIDHFVIRKLRAHNVLPSSRADRETLIRRVSFDLTGLPPTLNEIDAFLQDKGDDAFERVVDRLLDSNRFGERLASEWLDVARYSDTYGYQVDRDRYVWPWRDWVVRAFNANLSFDEFITHQLAGDLLPDPSDDQVLATTFNRLHPQKVEGGSTPEEFRIEYVSDRIQTFATAFLGLTMECARCHDHKYDPFTQREYYQLSAYFDKIDEAGLYSYFTPAVPTPTLRLAGADTKRALVEAESQIAAAESRLLTLRDTRREEFEDWLSGERVLPSPVSDTPAADEIVAEPNESEPSDEAAAEEPPKQSRPHEQIVGRVWIEDFEDFESNANQRVDGKIGQAIQLTGDDAFKLGVGNFTRFQPFTISLWMQNPEIKERVVVFHRSRAWTDAGSRGYELLLEEGRLSFALIHFWPGNALRVRSLEAMPSQKWIHVTVGYDGSSRAAGVSLFVDGERIETETVRDYLYKNITGGGGDEISIGERFRDRGFAGGLVDQFEVFDRQLTDLEVVTLFDPSQLKATLAKPLDTLSNHDRERLFDFYLAVVDAEYAQALGALHDARQRRSEVADPIPEIMVMRERLGRQTYLLNRGSYEQRTEPVKAETPEVLSLFSSTAKSNRLGLATWLTDPRHPLTARVAVNRYWQLLFGDGLVRTPEDFGSQGSRPTHPELLDWLAVDFIQNGWDIKRLLKQMVMSATYQQSSRVTTEIRQLDPENRLISRAPSHRLPAEMLRDNALYVSGLLVQSLGGPPAKPYEVEVSFKPATPDKGDGLYRRSLYTYWKRTGPAPVMMTLDAAKRDVCRMRRERTASPLQALVMFNGPQFVEASRAMAERLMIQHPGRPQVILTDMFRWLTGKRPTDQQQAIIRDLFDFQLAYFRDDPARLEEYLAVGQHRAADDSLDPATLAAFSAVANSLMNYDKSLTKF